MSRFSGLKVLWLSWFSKPAGDRVLYRAIRRRRPCKLMLLGLGDAVRARRMIWLAQCYQAADQIHFAGIDRFDSRPVDVPHFTLKDAHRQLRPTGVRVNLIPGDPHEALGRAVNVLHSTELVVISADQDADSLSRAWSYLSRLLAAGALVLREEISDGKATLREIGQAELERLAAAAAPPRRRAA